MHNEYSIYILKIILFSHPDNSYSKIDFFCLTLSFMAKVIDITIKSMTYTDYAPVIIITREVAGSHPNYSNLRDWLL